MGSTKRYKRLYKPMDGARIPGALQNKRKIITCFE